MPRINTMPLYSCKKILEQYNFLEKIDSRMEKRPMWKQNNYAQTKVFSKVLADCYEQTK